MSLFFDPIAQKKNSDLVLEFGKNHSNYSNWFYLCDFYYQNIYKGDVLFLTVQGMSQCFFVTIKY